MLKRKKILITGYRGIVGSTLVDGFKNDYSVFGLDKKCGNNDSSQFYNADVKKIDEVGRAFNKVKPNVVIHLAGDPFPGASWDNVLHNNIIGAYNIFESARNCGVEKIIYASSIHTVGMYEKTDPPLFKTGKTITKLMQVRPDSLYGVSKCFGENLGRFYAENFGVSVICLRIGAVLSNDDPTENERNMAIWLSHKDLLQLMAKSVESKDIVFDIFFGVSNNRTNFLDISHSEKILGYKPESNSYNLV